MASSLVFGVGCFFFSIREGVFPGLVVERYADEVKAWLSSLPNVTDVEVTSPNGLRQNATSPDGEPLLEYRKRAYPVAPSCKFGLHIPLRVQNELFLPVSSEQFAVTILDGYYGPVTYVEPVGSTDKKDGPTSVVLARLFLAAQSKGTPECPVRFDALGPSPFHAGFRAVEASEWGYGPPCRLSREATDQRGYDRYEIRYDAQLIDDIGSAQRQVHRQVGDELALYYRMMYQRELRFRQWYDIAERLDLISGKGEGIRGRLKTWLTRASRLQEIVVSTTGFEISDILERHRLEQSLRDLGTREGTAPLQAVLEKTLREMQDYPTSKVVAIAQFLESRRQHSAGGWVKVGSVLLGVLVGAVITAVF